MRALRRRGGISAEIVVAFDLHGIPRYGRMVPGWLVRVRPGDSVEVAFSTVYRRVRAVCARAGVRQVLPMDREFFTTGVVERLGAHRTRWHVPCPNYPRVAAALREFAAGRRGAVSEMRVSDGRGREAPYTMVIRGRKRREGGGGGGAGGHAHRVRHQHAVGRPGRAVPAQVGDRDRLQDAKADAHAHPGRDENVRIFCLVVSLMVYNAWTMLHPGRRAGGDDHRIPATLSRMIMLLEVCGEFGVRARLRPPRKPPSYTHEPKSAPSSMTFLRTFVSQNATKRDAYLCSRV